MDTKVCSKCSLLKNIDQFYLYKKTNKYRGVCKACQNALDYEWKKNNKDKVKEIKKRYINKNKEKIKIDTKQRNTEWYLKNKEKISLNRHTLKKRYERYIQNCKNKNREFSLSEEQFKEITSRKCFYCGGFNIAENNIISIEDLKYCGIDRVDNSRPYVIDNCVSCCNVCNRMKLELKMEDFIQHIKKILEFHK